MYGGSTLSGRFEAWNRTHLIKGYIAGDTPGNVALGVHILVATIVWLGGVLQLVPQIRERAIVYMAVGTVALTMSRWGRLG
jgi:hypothetical protein